MSRRAPNPAQERAQANQQTIKTLLKLETNKTCADCKRNKHPRWASWNLGIFICIRCSGIHRGMGTHISRVKSVDLDAWTDEQLASIVKWGNARANKYWEAKLAPGHVPSESKIENFIRTKYDSKRWVMDGGMPDPSTLDGEDVDAGSSNAPQAAAPAPAAPAQSRPQVAVDLFGDAPARPATTSPPAAKAAQQPPPSNVSPRQQKPVDSLLGLDFFGGSGAASNAPGRPASAAPAAQSAATSRPDLKQSILSLYASAPKPQSPPPPQQQSFGALDDAFSSLSFGSAPQAVASPPISQAKPSSFAGLADFGGSRASAAAPQLSQAGSFFDAPKPTPVQQQRQVSSGSAFGDFSGASAAPPANTASASADLFDFSSPAPAQSFAAPSYAAPQQQPVQQSSVFNLSSTTPSQPQQQAAPASKNMTTGLSNAWGASSDPWASTDAWGSSAAKSPQVAVPQPSPSATKSVNVDAFGWGLSTSAAPAKVEPEDDFGGWSSSVPAPPATNSGIVSTGANPPGATPKPGGNTDDLFGNVWG